MKKVKIITKENPIYLIRLIKDTHSKYFKNTKFKDFIPNFYGIAQCVEYNDKDLNENIILKNEMFFQSVNNIKKEINITSIKSFEI